MIDDNDIKKLKIVFATKDDLKQALKPYATKTALDNVEARLNFRMDKLEDNIKLNTETALTKFRSDIVSKLDAILDEIVKSREEREVVAYRLANHEDRLERVEGKLGLATE